MASRPIRVTMGGGFSSSHSEQTVFLRKNFNTVSGKSHILQGWDESEQIYLYIITTSVSDHEEIRGGSE